MDSDDEEQGADATSKKKLKQLNRISVAELKQSVKNPEVIEWVDITAQDPKLLVDLKSIRNSVQSLSTGAKNESFCKTSVVSKSLHSSSLVRAKTGLNFNKSTHSKRN